VTPLARTVLAVAGATPFSTRRAQFSYAFCPLAVSRDSMVKMAS